jgi:hypothetical protein
MRGEMEIDNFYPSHSGFVSTPQSVDRHAPGRA